METIRVGAIRSCAFNTIRSDATDYFETDVSPSPFGRSLRVVPYSKYERFWRRGNTAGHREWQVRAPNGAWRSFAHYAVFRRDALSSTEIGLLRAIITDNQMDAALVYSDFLEERGQCKDSLKLRAMVRFLHTTAVPDTDLSRYVARRFVNMAEHGFGKPTHRGVTCDLATCAFCRRRRR